MSEQIIPRDDGTPSILDQAKSAGWEAGYYDFGKGEKDGVHWFNPGLVETPAGIFLIARRSEPHQRGFKFGMNSTWACLLDESGRTPLRCDRLKWPDSGGDEQFEDARAVYHAGLNQVAVAACNFIWNGNSTWTGATQVLGFFDQNWECKIKHRPPIEGNPPDLTKSIDKKDYQKNWVPFFINGRLCILYKSNPWVVFEFGDTWRDKKYHVNKNGVEWKYGVIRGGTPPVLVDGLLWTFMHSSLPWKQTYRRYYAGAIAFESTAPFNPVMITPEPLLIGSQNDRWEFRKPPCVFPCGAVLRNGTWLISSGVNDLCSAWISIPHKSLVKRMKPVGEVMTGGVILPQTGLSEAEKRKEKLRANAAKARAALAQKRLARPDGITDAKIRVVRHRRRIRKKRKNAPVVHAGA